MEVLVRGGLPIVLPLLVHPAATLMLLDAMAWMPLVPTGWERPVGQGWLVLAALWVLSVLAAEQSHRLGEPLLLAIPFMVLPPLPVFAIYFICLHASAHIPAG